MGTVDLRRIAVAAEVLALVPRAFAVRHGIVPLAVEGVVLRVAMADPLETEGVDVLAHVLGREIETVLAEEDDLRRAIDRWYGREVGSPAEDMEIGVVPDGEVTTEPGGGRAETGSDAPIINRVQALIVEAVKRRASDIHVEPLENRLRVRYRVDGVLIEAGNPPKALQLAMVSRLKIMANISIAEKRLPQDGRIQTSVGGRSLDLRVSSLPTAHGESIVMRILDHQVVRPEVAELGLLGADRAEFERLVGLADGIVLVTGPTGSGKTTTLYSALHHLNRADRKIITVEDPVEYQIAGINQVPVRHDIGMTFASALRAMLRQAPNVIMVGEIRDRETADIAINASLTGHLVFSTLHTNDAPGAVTRLIDLGVKPFLISSSLRATLAQRLVRRICEECRRPYQPTARELRAVGLSEEGLAGAQFSRGAGCAACEGTGFRGRLGIFEIFVIDEVAQQLINAGASTAQLRAHGRVRGMRTMREDGARKASAGLTTIEEVVSITVGDAS